MPIGPPNNPSPWLPPDLMWMLGLGDVPTGFGDEQEQQEEGGLFPQYQDPSAAAGTASVPGPRTVTSDLVDLAAGPGATAPAAPTAPVAKVMINGKTYDYSRPNDRAPLLPGPTESGPLGGSREVVTPPSMFPELERGGRGVGGAGTMPPSRISDAGLANERATGRTGVSMMPGTDEQRAQLESERLGRDTVLATQRADLLKAQQGGPAVPGMERPRSWGDAKQDEQRARLMGIEQQIRARYDSSTPEGMERRKALATKAASELSTLDPKMWAALPPETKMARINQEVESSLEAIMRSEFERALVIESILGGAASPAAQYLRPRPIGTEAPAYYTY